MGRIVEVALGHRSYPIHIGSGLLDRLREYVAPLQPTSLTVVTNTTVAPLYADRAEQALAGVAPLQLVALKDGEQYKQWDSVAQVVDALAAAQADRRAVLVALGGGVVGDLAGFAAAIYMRGVRFVQVPTTLLAQVDSSVGGKTGINHVAGKNLIGAFHQPEVVVSDTDLLRTLPAREVSAGLAEILKHGLLADAAYFERTASAIERIRAGDADLLADAVAGSCEIKAAVVARDEREAGERALLNLGHTFGHAIEAMTGYARWLHGEAVGCGLVLAANLSRRVGTIGSGDVAKVADTVARAGLPTRIEGLSAHAAIETMRGDKKSQAGEIRFILLERIGRAVQTTVPAQALRETLLEGGFR
jgi:3-dehydroquinate synthase